MGKGKKSKKHGAASGALAGAATFLAGRVVNSLVKEVVDEGTDHLWHRGKHGKGVKHDVGLGLLKLLARSDKPLGPGHLAVALETDLISCLGAIRAMRRARLIKYGGGHRTVELTAHGRETLAAMSPPE